MRKINLAINIVLVVAVAVLFVLHFTSIGEKAKKDGKQEVAEAAGPEIKGNLRVAYVNIDSLLQDYQMYEDKRDEFVDEQSNSQAKLQSKSQQLQQEFQELKEKLNKGLITRAKARMMQQNLGKKEQELYRMRDQITSELAEKEQVIYRQVLNSVTEYLEGYADNHNYHFILSYSFGGPILYKQKKFNITQDVLEGLNEEYREKQDN
jgi:outer membrane protein